jgi:prepilin-type processing-associated H-X9-DG protein
MLYTSDHNGALIPAHYRTNDTVSGQWAQSESWNTILMNLGYLSSPKGTSATDFSRSPSILRCPSGIDDIYDIQIYCEMPEALDPLIVEEGAKATPSYSASGKYWTHCWYGLNGVTADTGRFPFGRIPNEDAVKTNIHYITEVRRAGKLVVLYDGVWVHNGVHQRINARHMNRTKTNVLFMDGHTESINRLLLPTRWIRPSGGCPTTLSALSSNAPTTNWRIDQE